MGSHKFSQKCKSWEDAKVLAIANSSMDDWFCEYGIKELSLGKHIDF